MYLYNSKINLFDCLIKQETLVMYINGFQFEINRKN